MSWNTVYKNSTGFNCSTQTTQSNFGVTPNYRLGMVQSYNLGIQRTLPQGVVLNIDYIGAYAGNLDIVRVPNRNATGVLNPTSVQFRYEDSLGYQRSNALSVSARERMHKGVSLQAAYTYSHSIDDASSVGGSGGYTAQNDLDLAAEESNSSFDHRQSLNVSFILEPPFGPNRAFLNKGGIWAHILDGYSISGAFTTSTGGYASPQYTGTSAELEVGANYLRPNRVPGQPIKGAGTRHPVVQHRRIYRAGRRRLRHRLAQLHPDAGNAHRQRIALAHRQLWRNAQLRGTHHRKQRLEHRAVLRRKHHAQLLQLRPGQRRRGHALLQLHRAIQVLATTITVILAQPESQYLSFGPAVHLRNFGRIIHRQKAIVEDRQCDER